ncbi:MAG: hypothetical protein VX626_05460 [Candidatus Thermoplasmatota archaeon]|nr:hypothetical protein [Candidatus Thermoplasmatota archaeon]
MGTSPRSRWSNRDDTSYQEKKSEAKTRTKRQPYNWVKPKADSSSPMLFVGQLTSLISLLMFNAGTGSSGSESIGGSTGWGLGGTALAVTILFGLFSFLFLFRVSFSRNAPKRRRRIARIWLLAFILATQLT